MLALNMPRYEELVLEERPIPECGPEEAIVRVKYAGICGSDMHIIAGENPKAVAPLVMGHESCGTVYAINSTRRNDIKVGDKVTMHAVISCGVCDNCRNGRENLCENVKIMGTSYDGFFQEYVKVRADRLLKFNDDVDMKAAALVEPLTIAVHDIRRSGLQLGEDVFVCGAGTIGTLIAKVAEMQGGHVLISEADDARIAAAKGRGFHVNLISVNPIKERNYRESKDSSVSAFKKILEKYHINVTIRKKLGADIDSACGQLRLEFSDSKET